MSYRTTKNKVIMVKGIKIAYREMSQGWNLNSFQAN